MPTLLPTADPIASARSLLPWWTQWGGLAYVLIAFALTLAVTWLATLGAYRVPATAHWTERARHAFAARVALAACGMVSAIVAAASTVLWYDGVLGRIPMGGVLSGSVVAGLLGASVVRSRVERRIGGAAPFRVRARGVAALWCVMFPHMLIAWIFNVLELGRTGASLAVFFAAGAVGVVLALWGGGVVAARVLGVMRPARPRVVAAVDEAARLAGVRSCRVYELAWHRANAFAMPHLGVVAFTDGAIEMLDDEGLRVVAAHELAHMNEPWPVRALRVAVSLLLALAILGLPVSAEFFGSTAPLFVIAGTLVVVLLFRRIARRMEVRADAAAKSQDHGDSRAYALALERLYEANLAPAVLRRAGVHPHLYDRLVAAGLQPSYPRPAPPPRRSATIAIPVFAVVLLILPMMLGSGQPRSEPDLLVSIAMHGGEPWQLGALAYIRYEAGDQRGAASLYRAEADLGAHGALSNLAIVLANQGLCDDARDALAQLHAAPAGKGARRNTPGHDADRAVAQCVSPTARAERR